MPKNTRIRNNKSISGSRALLFQTTLLLLLLQIRCSLDTSRISRTNWNLAYETFPQTLIIAKNISDVISCVSNRDECPTPVLAVASMHSVTACVVNDNATLLDMSEFNQITNYDATTGIVSCEPGVKMADLHDYLLDNHQREVSWSPEIGDATVGSLSVTTSKDSSINGPGSFSAIVTSLKYVNYKGDVITLDRDLDAVAFQDFICSFGMMGIVVEVNIETRPSKKILTRVGATRGLANADEAYKVLERILENGDNAFALVVPHEGIMVTEERYADVSKRKPVFKTLNQLNSMFMSILRRARFYTIQHGAPYTDRSMTWTLKTLGIIDTVSKHFSYKWTIDVIHYRKEFTNRYDVVTYDEGRLDFSLYIYDIYETGATLEEIFKDTWDFVVNWYQETGYAPNGLNMYFLQRTGKKPYGELRGPAGFSFAMDPYDGDPDSPEWETFTRALNKHALERNDNVRLSPTQSRFLDPGDFVLDKSLVHERFLTPYYANFVV